MADYPCALCMLQCQHDARIPELIELLSAAIARGDRDRQSIIEAELYCYDWRRPANDNDPDL